MKVAFSASEPEPGTTLELRFGRCAYFLIVDTETYNWNPIPNPAVNAMGGAGPQAAQFLADHDVRVVISGDFGPNAYTALQAADIRMYSSGVKQISTLLEEFQTNQLEPISGPTGLQQHGGRRSRGGRRR